jgi:dUTP pyrophosphatase
MQINLRRLDPEALPPSRAHPGDAGFDLSATAGGVLASGQRAAIGTGIAVEIPPGYAGLVLPRSGLARRHGISLVNAPGLIDSGYRGEIEVLLINHGAESFTIEPGQRIAQLVIVRVEEVEFHEVEELAGSERGVRGFGSSG